MKKVIDPVAIRGVGNYLQKEADLLVNAQTKLNSDIESILQAYRGVDAQNFIKSYTDKANSLTDIINFLNYYAAYMKNTADHYKTVLETSKGRFDQNRINNQVEGEKHV